MGHTYLPYTIANGERRTLYVTNTGMGSSLLRPNLSVGCDMLKLDAQGSEAEILEHARGILENCLIVHCEVELIQRYEGQALFAEVDQLHDRQCGTSYLQRYFERLACLPSS